jgi:starvation-inducible DNA-binding protein
MENIEIELSTNAGKQELVHKLSCLLADTTAYKFTAQGFHWNVRGIEFSQYHKFFQKLYEDADSAVDPLAEHIRKLGYDAPFTLQDFVSLSCIEVRPTGGDPVAMSLVLHGINQTLRDSLLEAFEIANALNQQGVINFLAERIDMHDKWLWQLGTIVGADATQVQVIQF